MFIVGETDSCVLSKNKSDQRSSFLILSFRENLELWLIGGLQDKIWVILIATRWWLKHLSLWRRAKRKPAISWTRRRHANHSVTAYSPTLFPSLVRVDHLWHPPHQPTWYTPWRPKSDPLIPRYGLTSPISPSLHPAAARRNIGGTWDCRTSTWWLKGKREAQSTTLAILPWFQ